MLLCISGSLRKASTNRKLLAEAARLFGGRSETAELRMPLYDADLQEAEGIPEAAMTLHDQIDRAVAIVIASPEYNHSVSGVLKNAVDWVSRAEGSPWEDTPLAIMSASAGRSGGARGTYALRLALAPFRPRFSSGPEVLLAAAGTQFRDDGQLADPQAETLLTAAMERLRSETGARTPHPVTADG